MGNSKFRRTDIINKRIVTELAVKGVTHLESRLATKISLKAWKRSKKRELSCLGTNEKSENK